MRKPAPQELYRHFKGGKYQVITIARDADTGEEQVVYQALYGEYTVYCRPLTEFVSEVDKDKYPNADQKMRFERFIADDRENISESVVYTEKNKISGSGEQTEKVKASSVAKTLENIEKVKVFSPEKTLEKPVENPKGDSGEADQSNTGDYMHRTIEEEAEDFGMNPLVVRFLDASSCAERLEVLNLIKPIVTNDMIDVMAIAIDTEIPGDDPDERCAELRECLITKQRFEVTRLR